MDQKLTECPNPVIEPGDERAKEIARRYHAIQEAGTISALADEFGVSRQTIYNCAQKFPPIERPLPPNRIDLGEERAS